MVTFYAMTMAFYSGVALFDPIVFLFGALLAVPFIAAGKVQAILIRKLSASKTLVQTAQTESDPEILAVRGCERGRAAARGAAGGGVVLTPRVCSCCAASASAVARRAGRRTGSWSRSS